MTATSAAMRIKAAQILCLRPQGDPAAPRVTDMRDCWTKTGRAAHTGNTAQDRALNSSYHNASCRSATASTRSGGALQEGSAGQASTEPTGQDEERSI